jgi:hypothetical protein
MIFVIFKNTGYKQCKFGCNQSVIKGILLEVRCTLSVLWIVTQKDAVHHTGDLRAQANKNRNSSIRHRSGSLASGR